MHQATSRSIWKWW